MNAIEQKAIEEVTALLPAKLSQMLKSALEDLRWLRANQPNFVWEMNYWVVTTSSTCSACLGGAALARRDVNNVLARNWYSKVGTYLGLDEPRRDAPLPTKIQDMMHALDHVRTGAIVKALQTYNLVSFTEITDLPAIEALENKYDARRREEDLFDSDVGTSKKKQERLLNVWADVASDLEKLGH